MQTSEEDALLRTVMDIVVEVSELPAEAIAPDKNLVTELDIDSLTMAETAVAIQDHFHIELTDEDMKDISTVRDLAKHLERIGVTV